jgi:ABC-type sugar transport system permease subunit
VVTNAGVYYRTDRLKEYGIKAPKDDWSFDDFLATAKPQEYGYVGLANYVRLLHDEVFWLTLWNSFVWVFGSVLFQFVGGFAAALVLHQSFRGRTLVRTLTLLPWIIPGVVVALIWEFIYQPNYGLLNDILSRAGLMRERVAWLSSPALAMPAVIVTNVWTLSAGLLFMVGQYEIQWGQLSAGVIISTVPVAILFTYLQRHLIQGLSAGAVKG